MLSPVLVSHQKQSHLYQTWRVLLAAFVAKFVSRAKGGGENE